MPEQPAAIYPNSEGQERVPGVEGQQDQAIEPVNGEGQRTHAVREGQQSEVFIHPSRRGGNNR
jgi:hypothetical protein